MPTTPDDLLTRLRAANPATVSPERANEPTAQATLERILGDARSDASSRPPRRSGRWLSAVPVLATTLITIAVVGAALVLVGSGHRQPPTSRPPVGGVGALIAHTPKRQLQQEMGYIAAATKSVLNSKACQSQQQSGVTYIQGSPGPDLLSILGVLRRPATPADRFNPQGMGPVPDVYRAYIRRALSADGFSFYIVPARYDRAASTPSVRCFGLQEAALKRYLPRIPASLRRPTREIQAALIAWILGSNGRAPRDTICFVAVGGNTTAGGCGTSPPGIRAGEATQETQGVYSGVVPNGVARVTVIFPAAAGHPERAVTVSVTGNVYAVRMRESLKVAYLHPPTVIWRSAESRVLKRIAPPQNDAAARARACRAEPIPCLLLSAGSTESSSSSFGSASGPVRVAPAPSKAKAHQ